MGEMWALYLPPPLSRVGIWLWMLKVGVKMGKWKFQGKVHEKLRDRQKNDKISKCLIATKPVLRKSVSAGTLLEH